MTCVTALRHRCEISLRKRTACDGSFGFCVSSLLFALSSNNQDRMFGESMSTLA